MSLRSVSVVRFAFLGALAALAAASQAQYVGGLAVTSVADGHPDRQDVDSWNFFNNTAGTYNSPTWHTVNASLGGGMDGSSYISGEMGTLRAASFAEYPYLESGKSAQAHTEINALDYLTVTDAALPVGTPVTLSFRYALSGTFSTPVFELGGTYSASAVGYLMASGSSGLGQISLRYENVGGATPYDLVGTMTAAVGDKVTLSYGLDTFAYVAGTATVARQASVDFSHTARAYAWSDDSGVTLVASSGHNYAAVPEPASIATVGLGALALLRRRRR